MQRIALIIAAAILFSTFSWGQVGSPPPTPHRVQGNTAASGAAPNYQDIGNANPFSTTSVGTVPAFVTVTTASPTALSFAQMLPANSARKACVITNTGSTTGFCNAILVASANLSNTVQVPASGGQFLCAPQGAPPASNVIACTCVSGPCAFVINEQ